MKDMVDSSVCLKTKSLFKIWLNISRIFLITATFSAVMTSFLPWVCTNQMYNQKSTSLYE